MCRNAARCAAGRRNSMRCSGKEANEKSVYFKLFPGDYARKRMLCIFDAIMEWLKALLVEGILENPGGLFAGVYEQVGEIAAQG